MYKSFEDLEVWKRSCQLAVDVYGMLKTSKEFSLRDQMQRAAVSIPSNIAEGSERGGKDFERFLRIAQGSSAELRTQAYIAKKIGVLSHDQFTPLLNELKEISRMLNGLRRSLPHNKLNTEN
ncbi:MAG: four helix bundle protein [bacterium]|nr:four helix bundle protein [bacterium]